MKKLLTAFIFFGLVGFSQAANLAQPITRLRLESFPSYPPVDVYVATRMAVAVTTETVIISSRPSVLSSIIFNRYGSADSKVELFNANKATFIPNAELIFSLLGNATGYSSSPYRIFLDSGVAVNITGNTLPDITVIYRAR